MWLVSRNRRLKLGSEGGRQLREATLVNAPHALGRQLTQVFSCHETVQVKLWNVSIN
jgi:hypothetical protein